MTSLAAALVEAQKNMPAVHKTGTSHHGSYATLDEIIEKTRPVLSAAGLAISQFPTETTTGFPGLKTVLLHSETGQQIEATVPLLLNGKNDMQALGGAITYARRYGWAAVLGIANDDDDDGNRVSAAPEGTSGRGAAPESGPRTEAASNFTAPVTAQGTAGSLKWKYGEHAGTTIAETPLDFVLNYVETGKPGFMVDKCKQFLEENGHLETHPDDGIPFAPTIDGLGN